MPSRDAAAHPAWGLSRRHITLKLHSLPACQCRQWQPECTSGLQVCRPRMLNAPDIAAAASPAGPFAFGELGGPIWPQQGTWRVEDAAAPAKPPCSEGSVSTRSRLQYSNDASWGLGAVFNRHSRRFRRGCMRQGWQLYASMGRSYGKQTLIPECLRCLRENGTAGELCRLCIAVPRVTHCTYGVNTWPEVAAHQCPRRQNCGHCACRLD